MAGAYVGMVVGFAWDPGPLGQAVAAVGIAAALVHASAAYGIRHALVLFAICNAVTFGMENLGVATGFPFGHYHFEVAPGLPHVGAIPLVVGPLWFGMGYFSWVVAGVLLGGDDHRLGERFEVVWRPVVAVFVMTQWDLVLEAPSATLGRAWVWHDGGAFFGVPASNFFGWLLTTWLFYQAFALYLHRRRDALARAAGHRAGFRLIAVVLYLSSGLTHMTPWLLGSTGAAADGAGHVWRTADIRESVVITMLLTMAFTSLLAVVRLLRPGVER
jgi:putative membrane protein